MALQFTESNLFLMVLSLVYNHIIIKTKNHGSVLFKYQSTKKWRPRNIFKRVPIRAKFYKQKIFRFFYQLQISNSPSKKDLPPPPMDVKSVQKIVIRAKCMIVAVFAPR